MEVCIVPLSYHCIFEEHNLPGFTGPKMERNFPQGELYITSHLYLAQMRLWIKTFFLRYLFLAVLGLLCWAGALSGCSMWAQ